MVFCFYTEFYISCLFIFHKHKFVDGVDREYYFQLFVHLIQTL